MGFDETEAMINEIHDRIQNLKDRIQNKIEDDMEEDFDDFPHFPVRNEQDELNEESNAEVTETMEEDELAARVNALHERINFLKNKIHDVQVTNEEEDSEIVEPFDEEDVKINEIRDRIQNLKDRIQNKIEDDMEENFEDIPIARPGGLEEPEGVRDYSEESNTEVTDTMEEDELAARVNALHERINFLKNKIQDV